MTAAPVTLPVMAISRLRMATDGAGVTTLVVSQGCPLRCQYCLNPFTWKEAAPARAYTPEELLEATRQDSLYFCATGGGITFGGGEPLLHSSFIAAFHSIAPADWRINIETSLQVPEENLRAILPFVHTLIVDCKDLHPDIYQAYTGRTPDRMLANLALAAQHLPPEQILVRVPLIPGFNTPALQEENAGTLRAMGFSHLDLFPYKTEIHK